MRIVDVATVDSPMFAASLEFSCLLAQQLLRQLDPPRRAMILMALLGLILLGITLVACVMIGARWARRLGRHRRRLDSLPPSADAHARWRQQLARNLSGMRSDEDAPTDETVIVNKKTDETRSE